MKKTFIIAITAILIVLAVTNLKPKKQDGFHIAANIPLSGPLAIYGEAIKDGSIFALESLGGDTGITIDWQDNQGNIKTSVSVLQQQLFNKKPDLYISGLKPQTQAITDILTKEDVPHFTWILDTEINTNSTNNFRNWINFKLEAEIFIDYAKKIDAKRVAITYVNLPSTQTEYQDIVIPRLKKQGVEDFLVEPFLLDKTDMKDVALKIKKYNPDLVIINGFMPQMVDLIKELHTLGFSFEGKTLASIDMLDSSVNLSNAELEGIIVAAPEFMVNESAEYKEWKNKFKKRFGYEPLYHHAYAYDNILIINEALKKKGDFTNSLRNTDITGITGKKVFDDDQSSKEIMVPAFYRAGVLKELK